MQRLSFFWIAWKPSPPPNKKGPTHCRASSDDVFYSLKLCKLHVYGIDSPFAFFKVEGYLVVILDSVYQTRYVYEILLWRICIFNETETFGLIKKLYCSFAHYEKFNGWKGTINNLILSSPSFSLCRWGFSAQNSSTAYYNRLSAKKALLFRPIRLN